MMKIQLLTAFLSLSSFLLQAQSKIEKLIAYGMDTTAYGLVSIIDQNNEIYILSNVQQYDTSSNSIPIGGYTTIGSGIIKLDPSGDLVWSKVYPTNCNNSGGTYCIGRIPSQHILLDENHNLIMPYSQYVGPLPCDSTSGSGKFSFKKGIMRIDSYNGETLLNEEYDDQLLCAEDYIVGLLMYPNGFLLFYYNDFLGTSSASGILRIDSLTQDFTVFSSDSFSIRQNWIQVENDYENIQLADRNMFIKYDFQGLVIDSFSVDAPDTMFNYFTDWAENDSLIVFAVTNYTFGYVYSKLYVVNKEGDVLSQKLVDSSEGIVMDVQITVDGEVLTLHDRSNFNVYDTLPLPIRVQIWDANLNALSSADYGFPHVLATEMLLYEEQNVFTVSGFLQKSIDLQNGKAPDEVYFLRDKISNLSNTMAIQSDDTPSYSRIYPNPVGHVPLNLILNNNSRSMKYSCEIFDMMGRVVYSKQFTTLTSSLSIDDLPTGSYVLSVRSNNFHQIHSFIKI